MRSHSEFVPRPRACSVWAGSCENAEVAQEPGPVFGEPALAVGFLLPGQPFLQGVLAGQVEVAVFLLPGERFVVAGVPRFGEGVPAEPGLVQQPHLLRRDPAGFAPDALVSLPVAEVDPAGGLVPVGDAQVTVPGFEVRQRLVAGRTTGPGGGPRCPPAPGG